MLVRHIKLKNWRNFRSVDVALGERVFLAGPNASGKSNFLDAFRFLRDISTPGGGLQKAVSDRGGLSKIRCLAAREHPDVEIGIELRDSANGGVDWKYEIGIKQQARGYRSPFLAYEKVWNAGEVVLDRPDGLDKSDEALLTQTHLEQISSNRKFRPVARFLESVRYLHLVPQLVRHSDEYSGPGVTGDPFGRNFLELVARTPKKVRGSRLKKIEAALLVAVPQIKALTLVQEIGTPHLEADYKHWRATGAKQREDQFSDGTLRLIGLLWAMLEGDALLLLEEPELSLNSGIVSKLPALFHKVQREKKKLSRQIILSTHSGDLLSDRGIGAEEVLVLTPGPEGTSVEVASSIRAVVDLLDSGLTIAEAVLPRTIPANIHQLSFFE